MRARQTGLALVGLLVAGALVAPMPAAASGELIVNPGLEEEVAPGDDPKAWATDTWGSITSTFTYLVGDAHSGERSVRVDVKDRINGDSKWIPDLVPVTGGRYYVYSDWYRSDVNTAVSVYYETASDPPDGGRWANLFAGIAPAAQWTQYRTGFTMPAGAVCARFVHFIELDGYLQTDDHSMTQVAAPPGFSSPMVSLTFDDGSQAFYDDARPLLDAKGFKTTQYIPTSGLGTDRSLMTIDELRALAAAGHEIGSHSVNHLHMKTLGDDVLAKELRDSKSALEEHVPTDVVSFAYPFGEYDARVIEAARAAGYTSGRSVEEGYNSTLDLELFDLRVQNITRETDLHTFKSWVDYARANRYWLILVYHEVVPDRTDPGPYDTTISDFSAQLDYLAADPAGNVMTVGDALAVADAEVRPAAGSVEISPDDPTTAATLTASPAGFVDPDGEELTYSYRWSVNDQPIAATAPALDLGEAGHGDHGDVVRVEVSARDSAGHVSAGVSDSVTVRNSPPVTGAVTIAPAAGAALTATASGFGDADGDVLTFTYAWYRNGRPIPGPNSATLSGYGGSAGDVIRVDVVALDGHGGTSAAASGAVTLDAVSAGPVVQPSPAVDRAAPKIRVTRPKPRRYRLGRRLTIRFTCADASGIAARKATLHRRGSRTTRDVKAGTRVRLRRAGRYVLGITATDRAGNRATKTVIFRVTRP